VLGEGGEFETLVVDGPRSLVRGRIVIREEDRRVVVEGGGSAWLRILDAKVVMKTPEAATNVCRVPDVLEQRFKDVLHSLTSNGNTVEIPNSISQPPLSKSFVNLELADIEPWDLSLATSRDNTLNWTVTGRRTDASHTISDEASEAILGVRRLLDRLTLPPSSIVSTMIILRSMPDFASVNSVPTLTTLNVSLPVLTTH
jgi:diphthine-ammonia ligase